MEVIIMRKIFNLIIIAVFLIPCMANFSIAAVDFPTKSITFLVPVAPGGIGDLYARTFGSVAENLLGKPFVVVNKPGASGQIALFACAQAAPDGHTLSFFTTFELYAIEWEIANGRKPSATLNDFIPIGSFNLTPYVITVPYNSPWKTLNDLINDAKVKPGYYTFGSGGMYAAHHITAESLMRTTGLKFRHVPYTGGGPLVTALVGSHVDFGITSIGSTVPLMRGNKLRILAVFSDKRCKLIQDIPTAKELGVDVESNSCMGIVAPSKTPMPIVEKLREVFQKVVEDKSFVNTIEKVGEEVSPMEGEEMGKFLRSQLEKVNKLYKQLIEEKK